MIQRINQSKEILSFIVVSFFMLTYLWTVVTYTSFMPIEDDYGTVLGFLNQFVDQSDTFTQFKMLFSQNADHRIAFTLMVETLQLKIFGEVNFLYLILFGNLGWLLTLYLIWHIATKDNSITLFHFIPVIIIMLSFSHSSLMTWATGSLQQYWQLLFSLLAIYFLINHNHYKAYALMIIAIFSSGGGFALIPIFALYYAVNRNWKQLVWTLLLSVLIILVYFIILDFNRPTNSGNILEVLFRHTYELFKYLLTFLGNFGMPNPIAMSVGAFLSILFLFQLKTFSKQTPFITWSILFIIIVTVLAGLSRSNHGADQALASRYSIYSIVLASLIYLAYLRIYNNHKIIFAFALVFSVFTYVYNAIDKIPLFEQRKHLAESQLAFPLPAFAEKALKQSYTQEVFTAWKGNVALPSSLAKLPIIHKVNLHDVIVENQSINYNSADLNLSIVEQTPLHLNITGWSVDSFNNDNAYAVVLVLGKNNKIVYLSKRPDVVTLYNNSNYLYSGINENITLPPLSPGKHILEIRTVNVDATGYYETVKIPIFVKEKERLENLTLMEETSKALPIN